MGSASFRYTGQWASVRPPKNVGYLTVEVNGAGSGPHHGGQVTGRFKIPVDGTTVVYVLVGGPGLLASGSTGGGTAIGGGGRGGTGCGLAGGAGGGGASVIRLNSRTGPVQAVAGGAGGTSGDGGAGGPGGPSTGHNGCPGNAGAGAMRPPLSEKYDCATPPDGLQPWGNATGGTPSQGGNGGTNAINATYTGGNATDAVLATGGAGNSPTAAQTYGGGGGGGGYHAGGGGQGGLHLIAPAGGGGGGANYLGSLINATNVVAGGGLTGGSVSVTWVDPPPANQPPTTPTDLRVNNLPEESGLATQSTGTVTVSAVLDDGSATQRVQLLVYYSTSSSFSSNVHGVSSLFVAQTKRATLTISGLAQNTQYWVRAYSRDTLGAMSTAYNATSFWTNRAPSAPHLTTPADNSTITGLVSVVFAWLPVDPDTVDTRPDPQTAFRIRWRTSGDPFNDAGPWYETGLTSSQPSYVVDPGTFRGNQFYDWTVRTRDSQNVWGAWADPYSLFITGVTTAPKLVSPVKDEGVDVAAPIEFDWVFRDPVATTVQTSADFQYRAVGESVWVLYPGDISGADSSLTVVEETFVAGVRYEWQVRTYAATVDPSDWSESATFWGVRTPGTGIVTPVLPAYTTLSEALGDGNNRAFAYTRGGRYLLGEVTPLASITWSRRRDDISNCLLTSNGWDTDCGLFLGTLRSWMHEIVVFRDGVRVWEGPITRITYYKDSIEIEAKDVMAYVYRRILRQGYDDSYRVVNGQRLSQRSVVERATKITINALAPDDPNVLPYLTSIVYDDDAVESRVVPDYSRTAWEEVDDLAGSAGLDYTTVGRRIIYWDTHRPIGRLPEMRDEDFSEAVIITEYGMQTATAYAVTNNSGIYGVVYRDFEFYGLIELLASAYGESEGAAAEEVLTGAARASLEATLRSQAERNMGHRYPTPLVVRVPDNASLNPAINLSINHLIPGVWVPLRATGTPRAVVQWQKLDQVTVTQDGAGEKIGVTLSPAPDGGNDPDADPIGDELDG